MKDRFTILGFAPGVPWGLLLRHENQALKNHAQNLQQLDERGGLQPEEAVAILEDRMVDVASDDNASALEKLKQYVTSYVEELQQDPAEVPVATQVGTPVLQTPAEEEAVAAVQAPVAAPVQAAPKAAS